jgi:general L-amino acid transport system substrate-binding protein
MTTSDEADPEQAQEEREDEKDDDEDEDEDEEYECACANSSCNCSTYMMTFAALTGLIGMILGSLAYRDVQVMIQSNPYYYNGGTTVLGNNVTAGSNSGTLLPDKDDLPKISMLNEILERGTLHCGLPFANTYGFLQPQQPQANEQQGDGDDDVVWTGFDVELCKAISAAIFGTPNFVPIVMDTADERWTMLASRDVDVVMRSTHTLERDVYVEQTASVDSTGKVLSAGTGFEFSPVYFYDGVVFGGKPPYATTCAEAQNTTSAVCESLRICAVNGTTHLQAVREMFDERHIRPQPNVEALYAALQDETCNVIAWERHAITESIVRLHGYTGSYETGTRIISREPIAMVTRQEDPVWTDFVFWIMQALVAAEEKGITQGKAMEFQTTTLFGERFTTMFQNALAATGNYGEIYEYVLHILYFCTL